MLAISSTSGCTDLATRPLLIAPEPARLRTSVDSAALGYFAGRAARMGLVPGSVLRDAISDGNASIVSVTPGWFQGAAQPQKISVVVSGPVTGVKVVGYGAILCSGSRGDLIAYDKNGIVLGSKTLSLTAPWDCGADDVTFGAQALLTVSQGEIARFEITPMDPVEFPVYGTPGGRASQDYSASLYTPTSPVPDNPPTPFFASKCDGLTFTCTLDARMSSDDNGIVSYAWTLGKAPDGTASGPVVVTTYPHSGWRTVSLTVTDTKGQTNTITQQIMVGVPPGYPPVVSLTSSCVEFTCKYTENVLASTPNVVRAWSFGDGATAGDVVGPTHTFATSGSFMTRVSVLDAYGLTATADVIVTVPKSPPVNSAPSAAFSWSCPNLTCTFDASASTDDKGIVSYTWDFNKNPDGTGSGVRVSTTYPHADTRTVTLTVTDAEGMANSVSKAITIGAPVNQVPVASFTYSCTNLTCFFDSSASTDDGGIVTRVFNFDDGQYAGGVVTATHTFAAPGTYRVQFTATDAGGLTGGTSQYVTVTASPADDAPPVARFTWTCPTLTCSLDARTSSDDKGIVSYEWDLNKSPGGTASGALVDATYPHGGARQVTLTVTDGLGQKSSVTSTITIP
ncbi:MAG: hypothetical protein JWL95_2511 [Gemmatimonadetes bacterium]|nr:hypothetical protein [Gemmatimonadota bacterium]